MSAEVSTNYWLRSWLSGCFLHLLAEVDNWAQQSNYILTHVVNSEFFLIPLSSLCILYGTGTKMKVGIKFINSQVLSDFIFGLKTLGNSAVPWYLKWNWLIGFLTHPVQFHCVLLHASFWFYVFPGAQDPTVRSSNKWLNIFRVTFWKEVHQECESAQLRTVSLSQQSTWALTPVFYLIQYQHIFRDSESLHSS